ncbi:hypothetical protein ABN584_00620 [Gloeocapsa sp. BRSZ]
MNLFTQAIGQVSHFLFLACAWKDTLDSARSLLQLTTHLDLNGLPLSIYVGELTSFRP